MITHDMHLLVEYTERTIVVSEGQIIADSTPIDVLLNNDLHASFIRHLYMM